MTSGTTRLAPLEVLYDAGADRDGSDHDLPPDLAKLYGGPLRLDRPAVYANFVSTIDGLVALPHVSKGNRVISDGSEADRFVMGVLRARADVVLVGSGTLHAHPTIRWTPEEAHPPSATAYAAYRDQLGLPPAPTVAVLSRSGRLDVNHPAVVAGAVVLTSPEGADRLRGRLPDESRVVPLGDGADPTAAIEGLRSLGHRYILSEAGPHVFGAMLAAGVVDELFLTRSPLLAGRSVEFPGMSLVEGTSLVPGRTPVGRLVGLRKHGEHLFLRYAFD
ncbi:MAG TPA: dihydrofolate reductase family protein [Actinopolymorphaceae bacterium]